MSDPLLPDLPDVPRDDGPPPPEPDQVPDSPNTDPEQREADRATGEEQATDNPQPENST